MYRNSNGSDVRPLAPVDYSRADNGQSDKYYGQQQGYGSGYNAPATTQQKKSRRKWWIIGGIILILVIVGAALGGYFGKKAADDNKAGSAQNDSASSGSGGKGGSVAGSGASATQGSGKNAIRPTATDQYGNPMYPTATGSAKLSAAAFTPNSSLSCGDDPYSGSGLNVRPDHPRLLAPAYKWSCLPKLIAQDSYMTFWNATIFENATKLYDMDPTPYDIDGGLSASGVLDVARQVQLKLRHWGYAWKMSNDTKWADRAWLELQTAAGNTSTPFGESGNNWNTAHFLDVAEFTAAFALGYDWFYDAWTAEQRSAIMWSILNLGLQKGLNAYTSANDGRSYQWWAKVNGNWNCVCNNGLIMGALAIAGDDPTTISKQVLDFAVENIAANCAQGPSPDGTWSETPNYWYFGTTGHAQAAASLLSATGSTQNLMDSNPGMALSGQYHMAVTGAQGLFSYGDAGPNKYTANANALMFYASQYNRPEYSLFQRDRGDAPDPLSMMYYDPQVTGQFFMDFPLDYYFANTTDSWVSMRSSWSDNDALYVAMKASILTGHQTHGDLDAGDFVLDALGQRWAGEFGNGDYLSPEYFSNETQGSERWDYFRKSTAGQNTLSIGENQLVIGVPVNKFSTTNESQNALVYTPTNSSTALFTTELTSYYDETTNAVRGIRLLNGRRQVLLQDEVTSTAAVQWRMFTNATVALSNSDRTATLTQNGQTLIATIQSPASVSFSTEVNPVRPSSAAALPAPAVDQPNPGVTGLYIDVAAGTNTITVLFNPQIPGASASTYVTPPAVALADWTLTSHE